MMQRYETTVMIEFLSPVFQDVFQAFVVFVFHIEIQSRLKHQTKTHVIAGMDDTTLMVFNMIFDTFFCCEVLLRLLTAPSKVGFFCQRSNSEIQEPNCCILEMMMTGIDARLMLVQSINVPFSKDFCHEGPVQHMYRMYR